ncbi:MAG TPA: gluconeogenesis factor YvcK family protein [Labilithrix sp.]|nr:gluconeogenesis factor YvcK family protein [Labilithrix sp.]
MRNLSDLPAPSPRGSPGLPRVVTLGGGHGQGALLSALVLLECELTAVVSVADDGGCSGKLREELGMAPPGDVRHCLVTLSTLSGAAALFEERLTRGGEEGRCVGNLVLAEMTSDLGSFQRAVDWVGRLLRCSGRVVPVAEIAGTLNVYDRVHGPMTGESHIERESASALVATVDGPEVASEEALSAIRDADILFMGPGSFVGSTLAVLTTGNVAGAVVGARGRRILVRNVSREEHSAISGSVPYVDHERILRDHLVIGSGGEPVSFDVLAHDAREAGMRARPDGTRELLGPVASDDGRTHDPARLAEVLALHLGLVPRVRGDSQVASVDGEAQAIFDRYMATARLRLHRGPGRGNPL